MEIGTNIDRNVNYEMLQSKKKRMDSIVEKDSSIRTTSNDISVERENGLQGQQKDRVELQEKTIINTIEEANKRLIPANKELQFSIHERTKQIMIKVIDKTSEEVIKEIPSEKILDMVATMCENSGLLVDEKV